MKITESKFKGVFIIELDIFNDSRGYFSETFNAKRYKDLGIGSTTFGQHFIIELSEKNHTQIFIPVGFAHGFAVLSEEAIFQYKCSEFYSKEHERAIRFDDPDLNINWGIENPIVSNKDRNGKFFKDIKKDFKI